MKSNKDIEAADYIPGAITLEKGQYIWFHNIDDTTTDSNKSVSYGFASPYVPRGNIMFSLFCLVFSIFALVITLLDK